MALVCYCDICNHPIKGNNFFSLFMSNPSDIPPDSNKFESQEAYYAAYNDYILSIQRKVKEICPNCKMILDKIFEHRMDNMYKVLEELKDILELPVKIPTKPKKGKNEK